MWSGRLKSPLSCEMLKEVLDAPRFVGWVLCRKSEIITKSSEWQKMPLHPTSRMHFAVLHESTIQTVVRKMTQKTSSRKFRKHMLSFPMLKSVPNLTDSVTVVLAVHPLADSAVADLTSIWKIFSEEISSRISLVAVAVAAVVVHDAVAVTFACSIALI